MSCTYTLVYVCLLICSNGAGSEKVGQQFRALPGYSLQSLGTRHAINLDPSLRQQCPPPGPKCYVRTHTHTHNVLASVPPIVVIVMGKLEPKMRGRNGPFVSTRIPCIQLSIGNYIENYYQMNKRKLHQFRLAAASDRSHGNKFTTDNSPFIACPWNETTQGRFIDKSCSFSL